MDCKGDSKVLHRIYHRDVHCQRGSKSLVHVVFFMYFSHTLTN